MGPRNISASVRARLKDRARAYGEDVEIVLLRFAIERLLYRLSRSEYANGFVLKGAMLFNIWADARYRASGDLDLSAYGDSEAARMAGMFREICLMDVEPDGVEFVPDTVRAEQTREMDEYRGARVKLNARISGAVMHVKVDVGFGDPIVPEAQIIDYPTLLEFPAPRLRAYSKETVVAEKFHAMAQFGAMSSRMKDFYDIWVIADQFGFEGPILSEAIRATFAQRGTELPVGTPEVFTKAFAENQAKHDQWMGFSRRTAITMAPAPFSAVVEKVRAFVVPPATATTSNTPFEEVWSPGGPWTAKTSLLVLPRAASSVAAIRRRARAEEVGFEPTVPATKQRFSRPPVCPLAHPNAGWGVVAHVSDQVPTPLTRTISTGIFSATIQESQRL